MKTVAVFIADPYCSVQCANGLLNVLAEDFRIRIFSHRPLEEGFFVGVDLIAVPGGMGDADQYYRLMRHHERDIRSFVRSGGAYLGVCMGAYWAGVEYLNILKDLDCVQYIRRPDTDTRRPHAKNISVTWQGLPTWMYFYDGCSIVGQGSADVWATYANGDGMAVQQGRIGLIGCHPESEQFWYDQGPSWMQGQFHQGRDWLRLREFVQALIKKERQ